MVNFMKSIYTLLFFYLLNFLFGSCSPKSESTAGKGTNVKIIYEDILTPSIKMSEIFNSYEFIALEASKSSPLIGEITKIIESNDRIVIFDREITNSVFVYDLNGKFIFRTNKGDAPTETVLIEDFCIDEDNENLLILDNGSMSIKKYNLINGEFTSSVKLKSLHVAISNLEDNYLLLSNSFSSASNMFDYKKVMFYNPITDPSQKEVNYLPISFSEDDLGYQFLDSGIGFVRSDSTTLFSEGYSNKIFQISNKEGSLIKSVEIDFGKNGLDKFISSVKSIENIGTVLNNDNVKHIMGAGNARSADKVIYMINNGGHINYLFVDQNLSEFISYESIFNDLFPLQVFYFTGNSANSTYAFFPPEMIANMIDNEENVDEKLKRVIDTSFNILRSNPILVKFYNE